MSFENSRSGGEWLETRLLTSGAHPNPWYTESSDRVCNLGEMISFDTDMVGPYGYCADLSRSWTCGYTEMNSKQHDLYLLALEQINHNLEIISDGMTFIEFNKKSLQIPEKTRIIDTRSQLTELEWPKNGRSFYCIPILKIIMVDDLKKIWSFALKV